MKAAKIFNHDIYAGMLTQHEDGHYSFEYDARYCGPPISLTMPVSQKLFSYDHFPAFFDGLLPEGILLEALLKKAKLDRHDYLGQLITVGRDLVGSVTVRDLS